MQKLLFCLSICILGFSSTLSFATPNSQAVCQALLSSRAVTQFPLKERTKVVFNRNVKDEEIFPVGYDEYFEPASALTLLQPIQKGLILEVDTVVEDWSYFRVNFVPNFFAKDMTISHIHAIRDFGYEHIHFCE